MEYPSTRSTVLIRKEFQLSKITAFLRANARSVDFMVDPALSDALVERLARFVDENPGRFTFEIVLPDGETLFLYSASGAVLGAVIGGAIGGLPGAAVGSITGALVGAAASGTKISVDLANVKDAIVLSLA